MAIITRFAPSPTGYIHLGNARTALFSYLWARQAWLKGDADSKFILRIEDTDQERSDPKYVHALCKDLAALGITWDIGPDPDEAKEVERNEAERREYTQSLRTDIYEKCYQQLQEKGLAYPCFCSEEELKAVRRRQLANGEPPRYNGKCRGLSKEEIAEREAAGMKPVLRLKVDENLHKDFSRGEVEFHDKVKGRQKFLLRNIGDFIVKKSDGAASFIFANAVDDALMGVNLVVRGDDHLSNTPNQLMILKALGLPVPEYAHLSLITGVDGKPLSKRNGNMSIRCLLWGSDMIKMMSSPQQKALENAEFIEERYLHKYEPGEMDEPAMKEIDAEKEAAAFLLYSCLPDALINHLARLGCVYESNDLMSLDTLAENFKPDALSSAAARSDRRRLYHWQSQAIQPLYDETIRFGVESQNDHNNQKNYVRELLGILDCVEINLAGVRDVGKCTPYKFQYLDGLRPFNQERKIDLLKTIRENAVIVGDILNIIEPVLIAPERQENIDTELLEAASKIISEMPKTNQGNYESRLKDWDSICKKITNETGKKGKNLNLPIRLALTGKRSGPNLKNIYALLGRDEVLVRLGRQLNP